MWECPTCLCRQPASSVKHVQSLGALPRASRAGEVGGVGRREGRGRGPSPPVPTLRPRTAWAAPSPVSHSPRWKAQMGCSDVAMRYFSSSPTTLYSCQRGGGITPPPPQQYVTDEEQPRLNIIIFQLVKFNLLKLTPIQSLRSCIYYFKGFKLVLYFLQMWHFYALYTNVFVYEALVKIIL